MVYYNIAEDRDPKVSGIIHGVSQGAAPKPNNFTDINTYEFLYGKDRHLILGEFPDEDFSLNNIEIKRSAKMNDFIDIALVSGFIISKKVQKIIPYLALPSYKLYDVTIKKADATIKEYKWLYFNRFDGNKLIDFDKSDIDVSLLNYVHKKTYAVKSYEDLMMIKNTYGMPRLKKLTFSIPCDFRYDLWGLKIIGSGNFISNKAVNILRDNNISGYKIFTQPEYEFVYR